MSRIEGAVSGAPRWILRAEGLVLLAAATVAYSYTGASLPLYLVLFLAPDLSFAAYLAGPRVGSIVYNAVHTTVAPALLAAVGLASGAPLCLALAAIWAAHIGLDRALGYGLKYGRSFKATHLGPMGRLGAT